MICIEVILPCVFDSEHTSYTLEGRPPSTFVRPVVGEGLCTLIDFVQNGQRE